MLDTAAIDGGDAEEQYSEEPDQEVEDPEPIVQELKSTNKSKLPGRRGRKPKATIGKENDEPADVSSANTSVENVEDEEPVKKRKGRPKAAVRQKEPTPPPADPTPPPKSSKRGRPARASLEDVDEGNSESRSAKRPKTSPRADKAEQSAPSKPTQTKEKSKPGRKRKSSGVGVDSPMIQRGPPLPKSRGLVTVRREETTAMKTTRSGRASFKPLEWWKGEHVEYDEEQEKIFEDSGKRHFKMPTVKGVVRTEENYEVVPKRRGRQPTGRKPGRRPSAVVEEEEIEREDWEYDPGRVTGEVVCWEPEHEFEPPGEDDEVEIFPEELAISENAIQLRDIKDATFKFAKTLTLPFFAPGSWTCPLARRRGLRTLARTTWSSSCTPVTYG